MRRHELPGVLAPGAVALAAREVSVEIDGARILSGVGMRALAGRVHALVGPNGAGKSTLLAVLAGDVEPSDGSVSLAERELGGWTLRERARRRAVLSQENGVFFPFTVRQVVEMGRTPWLSTEREAEDDAAVEKALADADVTRFAERALPTLSGGERSRAQFARVLAQRTGVLLLDEPTAALDIRHQEAVLALARDRARAGDAVVIVLHDLSLAAAYADEVTLLDAGRVVASGPPRAVFTAATLSSVYGHPIDVIDHPRTGALLVLPVRETEKDSR